MKLVNLFKSKIWKAYVILPVITLFCLTGFIASLLFPNMVLDTYVINMAEEEGDTEQLVPLYLGSDHSLYYIMDTQGRSMRGIQIGIAKSGKEFLNTNLVYVVSNDETQEVLSENRYAIKDGQDLQYVYLPYANSDACKGRIRIDFYLEGEEKDGDVSPCIVANHREVKDTVFFDGVIAEDVRTNPSSLKCSYIYSHETYPFLYDFRIMTFVFLAVSMATGYPFVMRHQREKRTEQAEKKKEKRNHKSKKKMNGNDKGGSENGNK